MTKSLFIAAAAVAAFATQARAQDQGKAANSAPLSDLRGNWLQADTTRQQAQQRADMIFQRLDANRDGVVTKPEAEQMASQMGGKGGNRFASRMIDRLFSQSGSVTQAQFQAQAMARFDRQDANRDGVVSADERQQARAAREQGN